MGISFRIKRMNIWSSWIQNFWLWGFPLSTDPMLDSSTLWICHCGVIALDTTRKAKVSTIERLFHTSMLTLTLLAMSHPIHYWCHSSWHKTLLEFVPRPFSLGHRVSGLPSLHYYEREVCKGHLCLSFNPLFILLLLLLGL